MNLRFRQRFMNLWRGHFDNAALPIAFYYTDSTDGLAVTEPGTLSHCVIKVLSLVQDGKPLLLDAKSIGCGGGRRYLGFSNTVGRDFEYFLSYGIPGKLEGERYKKSPELVKETMRHWPVFQAPATFAVFKRWDLLDESDNPEVVVFWATPDVLSGLFTLANYDESEPNVVIAPMGAGCASIVLFPYLEVHSPHPRAVLGMFDVSARPHVPPNALSFAIPMAKFTHMVNNMEECFLITRSWQKVRERIKGS